MTQQTLGQRIAERRRLLGLSQEALGERLGVSRQAISKWESDGTVPEIDKLITLSGLFGVSVGWLLGTEEEPGQRPAEGFTEEQIRLVEELVHRYQPAKPGWQRLILPGLAVILALIAVIRAGQIQIPNYQPQLDQLSNEYNSLRDSIVQLNHLPAKLEEMRKSDQLLQEYEFHAAANQTLDQVEIRFTAVPGTRQSEEYAYLSVREEGKEVAKGDCVWDGAAYTAFVHLPPAEEYDYYFSIQYADGTQKQQVLYATNSDHYAAHPAEGMRFDASASLAWQLTGNTLFLMSYNADLGMPALVAREGASWKKAELLVKLDGKELLRSNILDAADEFYVLDDNQSAVELVTPIPEDADAVSWISKSSIDLNYKRSDVTPGQVLEVWVELELSNGVSHREMADSFVIPG